MDETTQSNVLIAGTYGDTTQTLTKHLVQAGHTVYTKANNSQTSAVLRDIGGVPIFLDLAHKGEVLSNLKMAKTNILVSFSPLVDLMPFNPDPIVTPEYVEASATATADAAKAAGVDYVIYVSSTVVYGITGGTVDEKSAPRVTSVPLVTAGIAAETKIRALTIPTCIVRAGYVYSATNPNLNELAEKLPVGRTFPSGPPDNHAGWVHSNDLADALVKIVEQQPTDEIFNIVDDAPVAPHTFLSDFGDAVGVSTGPALPNPLNMFFTNKTATALLSLNAQPTAAKAKDQLGWTPKYATHEAGLEDVLLTWRAAMSTE